MDTKEFELPETVYVWDIENRVFQSLVLQCLARIEGIALLEGNLFDSLLGRDCGERVKGIYVEQEQKNHAVSVKVEVNIAYGVCIPDKAEEIQAKVTEEINRLTGLRVGCVHVIFKNLFDPREAEKEVKLALEM
ncbi:MAG: Asp23/Gls24 family envelope stress response protein [Chlamydiota bacterium]